MQLKPRYKQTEVGMIPEDWDVKKLGNLGRIIRGASPRPQGDRRYYGGNIPRLMVEDVTRDGKYVTPRIDFLTEEGARRSRPCKSGTLTIVCSGTVGIPSFLSVDACIHDGFLGLVDLNKYVSEDYLYHQLMILKGKFEISATHGGVFTNLTTSILNDFQIPLPPLSEQRAIATALSDVDALITSLDRLIAKKRDIKQATMQQLLTGKTRLPGFSREIEPAYKQTEIGVIPDDWEVHSIEEIADVTTGDKDTQDKTESGTYPFFVRSQTVERINSYAFDGEAVLTAGDGVGVGKVFHYANGKFNFHQRVYMIYNFRKFDGFFFYLYFSNNFSKAATKYNAKNSVDSIRREMVTGMRIPHPPFLEQQAIATILSDMDAEIAALEQRRDKTRAIKQGMMQELLTGKTRLL